MTTPTPFPSYESTTEWLRGVGDDADVVLSSRARVARNLAGLPFVGKATPAQRREVLDACRARILGAGLGEPMAWFNLHECSAPERTLLVERHLISKQHAKGRPLTDKPKPSKPTNPPGSPLSVSLTSSPGAPSGGTPLSDHPRGVAVSRPSERVSIMVNEEDHLRMQAIRSGFDLRGAWAQVDQIDDAIEAGLDYAYSPRFGYLTACPTNVGTGVRMSVMLHLPALKLTGEIEKVKRAAGDMNLAVRGFYGEGSEAVGDFYQISNQTTLGKTEALILHELHAEIIPKVIDYERAARRTLVNKRGVVIEDQVWRAYGTLQHARLLTTEEAMQLLSYLRLGVVMGFVKHLDAPSVNQLMLLVQPFHLQRVLNDEMDQDQRRAARANLVRRKLGGNRGS